MLPFVFYKNQPNVVKDRHKNQADSLNQGPCNYKNVETYSVLYKRLIKSHESIKYCAKEDESFQADHFRKLNRV